MPSHVLSRAPHADWWRGVGRLCDPKITLASVSSMLLGAALAGESGPLSWRWLLMTVLGIFFIEVAKNASGELFDWDSGDDLAVADEDRSPFSGGKRVLVDGLLTRRQTWTLAVIFYALGAAVGTTIAFRCEPRVLWLGVLGMALAYFYHSPPLKLAYRGLGELTVTLTYGPLICAGTYLVQRHALPTRVLYAVVPLTFALASFNWLSEFPDRKADAASGKKTLVVRLGALRAARLFPFLVAATYLSLALLPLGGFPRGVWLGALGLPFSLDACRRVLAAGESTHEVIPAQARALIAFMLMAIGVSAGLLLF